MKHPEKWRETINPFSLKFNKFILKEIIGYPHAGNDVFQAKGIFEEKETEVFIKVKRQLGADIFNEIKTINLLNLPITPEIIDFGNEPIDFIVTKAKTGERLSTILNENSKFSSLEFLFEYGQTLAKLHLNKESFDKVKERKFFNIPEKSYFDENNLEFVYKYLILNKPKNINYCFCHGDFHYANILWNKKHISAILDFELSGIGNKEFDIAWAIILRPEQKFLKTDEELNLFFSGYKSINSFNLEYVKYYMILIYSYFYNFQSNSNEYKSFILNFFKKNCI